jgi:hypothetical protein
MMKLRLHKTLISKKLLVFAGMYFLGFNMHAQIQWVQKGSDIDGENPSDNSGIFVDVSADGNTLAVGAHLNDDGGADAGQVRVYSWNGSAWVSKGADIDGEAAGDHFGEVGSLDSDGNTIAIGARYNDGGGVDAGHVRVFTWNGNAWIQKGTDIDGEAPGDWSGYRVKLSEDGNTLAVGATLNDGVGTDAGHVRVYTWSGTAWTQKGTDIDGEAAGDRSGVYIDMSSDANTVAIAAYLNDGKGTDAGHVRVFDWDGNTWVQKGLDIDAEYAGDNLSAVSLSADGKMIAVGARFNGGGASYAGHVRIFEWNGDAWTQKGGDIDGEAANDLSGLSVNLSGDGHTVSTGAYYNDGGGSNAGHVRVFSWNGIGWTQKGADLDGEAANDYSGLSESLSADGNIVAIGAYGNDGNGSNSGHARVYYACTPTNGTDVVTACDSYTWIDGNTYTESNNTATHLLTNAAGCDSTVTLNLTITHSTTGTDVVTACDSYTWIDGITYTESNNSATYTLSNSAYCDSVVTLDLTINSANAQVNQDGTVLTAGAEVGTYQWVDCDNDNLPLVGETGRSFTATMAGNYAVEVTQNGCKKLSDCMAVVITGLEENALPGGASIFPNPSDGTVHIVFGSPPDKASVKVYTMSGTLLYLHDNITNSRHQFDLDIEAGIYVMVLETQGKTHIRKLVRQ